MTTLSQVARPRVLINASTCVVGGGVQVAVGFLHHVHQHLSEIGWEVVAVASPQVYAQCKELPAKSGWRLELITPTPAAVFGGFGSRRRLHALIFEFRLEACFTVFGPSYLWLDIPELCGFADPSVTNPNPYFLRNHPLAQKVGTHFRGWVKRLAVRRVTSFWVETATAQAGLARQLSIAPERIGVIPNALNPLFMPSSEAAPLTRIRFLHLAAFYYHKNHAFLLPVAQAMRRLYPDLNFEFAVTLPEGSAPWNSLGAQFAEAGLADRLVNLGYLSVWECPAAYRDCHVVFHPSLLEVFSATYLEAFASHRPVVATDLDFAHEVCGDAALYFDPVSAEAGAVALVRAAMDPVLRAALVSKGLARCAAFPPAQNKNTRLVELMNTVLSR